MKIKHWILVFTVCLCLPSQAATSIDPALKWKTIETPHFSIHYYPAIEDVARKFAPIAEAVYNTMTKAMKYRLDLKTQVTLLDATDNGNGFTTVFPYPNITLYLTDLSGNLNPYKYDDYLYYLFLHEYTHALHLDIAEGGVSLFRAIFGRMMFPNAMEPNFMTEGIATYMETKYTNAGRGRDPRWQMMMRMDILDENIKTIDQAAVETVKWPMGHTRYLYGVMFLDYLSETYGEAKLVSLVHVYGDFLFSIGIDGAFTFIYGKNLSMLWNEWLDDARAKYQKQVAGLGRLTEPRTITDSGYYHNKPKWSKDSRTLFYIQRNADDYPQIRKYDLSSGDDSKLFEGMVFDDALNLSPDGRSLLFSKADTVNNFYTFKDLYVLDIEKRELKALTHGMRAGDPAFSPDGAEIVYVKNGKGEKSLAKLQLGRLRAFSPVSTAAGGEGTQYFSPSYSPDGKWLVAAKRLKNGDQKIIITRDRSGSEEVLIPGDENVSESNPSYSPDGEYILLDSDRSGIVNLYAFHLKSRRLYQLTNMAGGAMMPDLSPDGKKIAYISYSSRGYDVALLDVDVSSWKEVAFSESRTTKPNNDTGIVTLTKYPSHDYNPWPSLLPTFWIPYNYSNENGDQTSIYIGGSDPLMQHIYYLNLGYDFSARRPAYTFYYANNQFLPQITIGLSDSANLYSWSGSTYWERERDAIALCTYTFNRVFTEYDRQAFSIGMQNINLSNISTIDSFATKPSLGNITGLLLAWRYLSSRMYAASISPEDGIDLKMTIELNRPGWGSDYSFTNYSSSLRKYFKGPFSHHVLTPSISGFYSQGDQLQQSNFSWRYLALRGYPSTTLQGNKGILSSLEYRFPIGYPEKGLLYGYTFFDRVWGDLFFDYGGASFGGLDKITYKRGVGVECNLDLTTLWYLAATIKFGYAKGLDAGGEEVFYVNLGL